MIYFSSYIGKLSYPYMICDYRKSFQIRKFCTCLFVDSGIFIKDRNIKKIVKYQKIGDVVSPPDIVEDKEQTIKNTLEWYNYSKYTHDVKDMCIVLQGINKKDYIDCFNSLKEHIPDLCFIGIGGLLHSTKNKVMVKEILSLIPYFKKLKLKIHIFGLGLPWIRELLQYEPYSFDCSTIVRTAVDGFVLNQNLKPVLVNNNNVSSKFRQDLAGINNYQVNHFIKNYKEKKQQNLEV